MVTSPAELCRDPFTEPVQPIPMPIAPASATLRVAGDLSGTPQHTVPLILALEYAAAHRAVLERTYPAADLFRRCVAGLAEPAEE